MGSLAGDGFRRVTPRKQRTWQGMKQARKEKGERTTGKMSPILTKLYFSLGESDISAVISWAYHRSRWVTVFVFLTVLTAPLTRGYMGGSLWHKC